MDDILKEALEIVKAQATVRAMNEDEMISMVRGLYAGLVAITDGELPSEDEVEQPVEYMSDPRKAIKEKTVTCLECGKTFKILTRKHLAGHGLEVEAYREKWGIKKGTPLVCKGLQRERRKKMKDMKLWEKRRRPGVPIGAGPNAVPAVSE